MRSVIGPPIIGPIVGLLMVNPGLSVKIGPIVGLPIMGERPIPSLSLSRILSNSS